MYCVHYVYDGVTVARPLMRSETRARKAADRLPMGYVRHYPTGEVVHVSRGALQLLARRLGKHA